MHGVKYRSDIDGLRTLAVVPVLLFHLGVAGFSGGFVGVDVFFVISGFLITSAIRAELQAGTFTITGFYERRARRILPALIVVIGFCALAGALLFAPENYKRLGASMIAAALFCSNFLFWQKTDYFNGSVDLEPLVHSWSLAVEEQYYILFPLFLMLIARRFGGRYLLPTLVLTLASFAISVAMTYAAPTGAYYLPWSRAWELFAGALLALEAVPPPRGRRQAEAAAGLGLALILGATVLLSGTARFPGVNALWPVLGAALILHAGASRHRTLVARLLGTRPFVGIGLISYSLYLWHWPLIVFTRYWTMAALGTAEQLAVLAASFALAALSWRFVERPFRNRHRITRRPLFLASAAGLAVVSLLGGAVYATGGFKARFAKVDLVAVQRADQPRPGEPNCFIDNDSPRTTTWAGDACVIARGSGRTMLVWGDSHAYEYRQVIARAIAPSRHETVVLYTAAGCPPVFGAVVPARPLCFAANARVPDLIRRYHIDRVVMSSAWQAKMAENGITLADLAATLRRLASLGVEVRLLGDGPDFDFDDIRYIGYRLSRRHLLQAPYLARPKWDGGFNRQLQALVGAERFADPRAVLCPAPMRCLIYDQGRPLMGDGSHLTDWGTQRVAPVLARLFD